MADLEMPPNVKLREQMDGISDAFRRSVRGGQLTRPSTAWTSTLAICRAYQNGLRRTGYAFQAYRCGRHRRHRPPYWYWRTDERRD